MFRCPIIGLMATLEVFGFLGAEAIGGGSALSDFFADLPAPSLIRRLEPGPGVALLSSGPGMEPLSGMTVRETSGEVQVRHPAGGWLLCQKRLLGRDGFLRLDTTVQAARPGSEYGVALADLSFRVNALGPETSGYRELTYRNDTWYGSTFWSGPDWTRVGKNWQHPGTSTPSVRTFLVPRDGQVVVSGRVFKAHLDGDGVRAAVVHNARLVWQTEIEGKDAHGVDPQLKLAVQRGDVLRFVIHKRGEIFCDTTYWDPVITYKDGGRYQASEGFSTRKQGDNGWFYQQVEGDRLTGQSTLSLLTYDVHLNVWEEAIGFDHSLNLDEGHKLPLVVVTDRASNSGLVIAMPQPASWRGTITLAPNGVLRLRWIIPKVGTPARAGEAMTLPRLYLAPFRGSRIAGAALLSRLLRGGQDDPALAALAGRLDSVFQGERPELDLWTLVQSDWKQQDRLTNDPAAYAPAAQRHLAKARTLLADLRARWGPEFLAERARQMEHLSKLAAQPSRDGGRDLWLYFEVRKLKREFALANPLLTSHKVLFCKRVPTSYSHLVMQYFGWRARPGGGIFVLDRPGRSLSCRDLFAGALAGGNVLEPRLSFDARRIVFSYVRCSGKQHDPLRLDNVQDEDFYHVWEGNLDGTGLRQLTSGPYDDLMPSYLPDGGIVFSSTRRRGYARCFGPQFSPRWHVYTLHRMEGDGRNLRTLSFHDTNEWFPTVGHDGQILYSRWDYIDRDAVTHQNLWATRPDGTNPRALWGNASPTPHCCFQLQAIPGSSRIIFTASAHHSIAGGSLAIVDPRISNNSQEALQRLTPEIPFPEAESNNIPEYYAAPWPLSENYFLVAYSPEPLAWEPAPNPPAALGIYLLDAAGNRELLYRDPDIGSTNPCLLAPRPVPPVLANSLPARASPTAEMILADVYQGLGQVPRGSIKELRVVQIFPRAAPVANTPPIGLAGEENGRAILGTVPVEPDGSAYFTVPARKGLLFQALDENGQAYQTMRSLTYLQPGERSSCVGCHEKRLSTPGPASLSALHRPPSHLNPGELGGEPFSFMRVVQPLLDRHCTSCHGGDKPARGIDLTRTPLKGFSRSYWALCGDKDFSGPGTNPTNATQALVPRYGARNQIQVTPAGGLFGARGSRLLKILRENHQGVKLNPGELRRLAAWIDLNAIFYGVDRPEDQARMLRGEAVPMPEIQ